MPVTSTSALPGNVLALRAGFDSVAIRDVISADVGRRLDEAGIRDGVRRRALERADVILGHLRVADVYLAEVGILRTKARPRAVLTRYVEHVASARLQLRVVSGADAEPRLAELEERLGVHFATLRAQRPSPLGERAAPWLAVFRRLADELARLGHARVSRTTRIPALEAADRAADAEHAQAELRRKYGRPETPPTARETPA